MIADAGQGVVGDGLNIENKSLNTGTYYVKYTQISGSDPYTYRIVSDHLGSPRLVIDTALHGQANSPWPRWEEMRGIGAAGGFTGAPKSATAGQKPAAVPAWGSAQGS